MHGRRVLALGGSAALHVGALAGVLLLAASLRQPEPLFVDLTTGAPAGDERPHAALGRSPGPRSAAPPAREPARAIAPPAAAQAPSRPPEMIPALEAPRPVASKTAAPDPAPAPPSEPATDGGPSAPTAAPAAGAARGVASDAPGGAGPSSGAGGGSRLALAGPGAGRSEVPAEFGPYLDAFRRRIQELVVYPLAARRQSLAGRVEVEVLLDPSGRVRDVAVVASSSHAMLDDAALEAVRSLAPVPLPQDLPRRPLRVRLPIVFDLR